MALSARGAVALIVAIAVSALIGALACRLVTRAELFCERGPVVGHPVPLLGQQGVFRLLAAVRFVLTECFNHEVLPSSSISTGPPDASSMLSILEFWFDFEGRAVS